MAGKLQGDMATDYSAADHSYMLHWGDFTMPMTDILTLSIFIVNEVNRSGRIFIRSISSTHPCSTGGGIVTARVDVLPIRPTPWQIWQSGDLP